MRPLTAGSPRLVSWLTRGRLAPAPFSLFSRYEAGKPARWDRVSPARQRGSRALVAACRLAAVVALAAAGLQAATGTATVNVTGGVLTLTEVGATSGSLEISSDGTNFIFSDSGAYMIVIDAGGMAAGCSLPGVNIICPMSSVTAGFNVVAGSGDTEAVTVSAPINVSGSISIASGGSLSLSGNLSGPSVILTAAGAISQTPASIITGIITGSLQASGFSVSLTGSNHVSTLGGSASNGVFSFVNSGTVSVNAISATAGVEIVATSGNIGLASTVTAEGENVVVLWAAGAIMNTGGSSENVTAAILQLTASTGIGTSTAPLVTAVGELSASNSTSGGIFIANTGALTVDSVVDNGSGMDPIVLTNAGTLTTSTSGGMAFSTNGNVSVTTTGANSDLVAGAAGAGAWTVFNSTAGTITATAGRDLLFGDGGDANFQAQGAVSLRAGRDITLNNNSYTVCESVTATAGGNVSVLGGAQFYTSGGAIDLTTGAGGTFTANAGGSNGDLQSSGYDVRVTADIINLEDTTSINAGAAAAVTLQPVTASQAITLVGAASTTAGNWYGVGNVTAGSLLIGNAADTGGIDVAALVSPSVNTVTLETAGTFSGNGSGEWGLIRHLVLTDTSTSAHTWNVTAGSVQEDGHPPMQIVLDDGVLMINGGNGAQSFSVAPNTGFSVSVNGGASLSNSLSLTSTAGASLSVNTTNPYTGLSGSYTFSGGNQPVSFSHIEYGPIAPPTITTSFSPPTIQKGAGVTVQISISQSNAVPITGLSALSQVSFTDTLPTGLTGASVPSNTCGGAINITGQTLTLGGGTVPLTGSCAIAVQATASAPGSFINQTGAVSALESGPGAASSQATLTVRPTVTITAPSVPYGDSALVTVTLDSSATGTITLVVDSQPAVSQTFAGGSASFTLTGLAVGTHDLSASYSLGNYPNSSATSTLTMNQAATSVTLGVNGQSVAATVSVIAPGAGTPTGAVTFLRGSAVLGTVALNGPTATLNNVTAGSVTATYQGDTDFAGSTSLPATVYVPTSSISVGSGGSPSALGQSVTFTAILITAGAAPPAASPTGTVQFYDGAATLGSAVSLTGVSSSGGQATYATSALVASTHNITAKYNGDGTYSAAQSSGYGQVVQPSLTISAPPVTYGVTGTVTVTAVTNAAAATGTVKLSVDSGAAVSRTLTGGTTAFSLTGLGAASHALSASYAGDANFAGVSGTSTLTVNQASTSVALSVNGQSVTATVSVTPPGAGTPTGYVDFHNTSGPIGKVALTGFTATLNSVPPGSVTATYLGDTNFVSSKSSAAMVYTPTSSISVTSGGSPSALGQSVTFAATLTTAGGPPSTSPGSTVQFYDGAAPLGSPVSLTGVSSSGGQASYATSGLVAGTHNITAKYNGDGTYPAAQSSGYGQVVQPGLTIVAPAVTYGVSASVRVTVVTNAAAPVPGGTITLTVDGGKPGQQTLTGGAASFNLGVLGVGAHTLSATYSGDANFIGVSATSTGGVGLLQSPVLLVSKAATAVALSVTGPTAVATVSVTPPGAGTPTGTVQFLSGTTVLATMPLQSLTATLTYPPAGTLKAVYSGDGNFNSSTSSSATVYVANTSLSVSSSANPSTLGQAVTFTATVSSSGAPPSTAPSGTVRFSDGAKPLGSATLSGGQATYSTASLGGGTHSIFAQYSGDSTYPAAQVTYNQVVSALAIPVVAVSPASPVYGQPVTFTATVSPSTIPAGFPIPTGQVTFLLNNTAFVPLTPLGTVALCSAGTATFTTSALATGTNFVTVEYGGDSTWVATYQMVMAKVGQAATSSSVSLAVVGGQLTLTAAVAAVAPGAGVPTGSVQFVDKTTNTVIATASLTSGRASANAASNVAAQPIVAVYSGDTNFQASTSAPLPTPTNAAALLTASFAPDEIASVFNVIGLSGDTGATQLLSTSLGGATVTITDSTGAVLPSQLYGVFGDEDQINLVIPSSAAPGPATVTITLPGGGTLSTVIVIGTTAPGIFAANQNGQGVFAGQVVYGNLDGSQTYASPAVWNPATKQYDDAPINLGPAGEQVYLVLYGTGIRHAGAVAASVNGVSLPVAYYGAQSQYPGLDQLNLEVPGSLAGAGLVNLVITVDGQAANTVTFSIE